MRVLDHIDREEIDRLRAAGEFFWLDLVGPGDEAIDEISSLFDIHPIAVEDLKKFGQRPKIDDYPHYLHMVFYGMEDLEPILDRFVQYGQTTTSMIHSAPVPPRPLPVG